MYSFINYHIEYQELLEFTGHRKGRSLLMEDGALDWLIANSNTTSTSTQRHIELALCHLAQNGKFLTGIVHDSTPHSDEVEINQDGKSIFSDNTAHVLNDDHQKSIKTLF